MVSTLHGISRDDINTTQCHAIYFDSDHRWQRCANPVAEPPGERAQCAYHIWLDKEYDEHMRIMAEWEYARERGADEPYPEPFETWIHRNKKEEGPPD